ncbi:MAG TPA: FkbM family methyltransferase [Thermoanaerobaculia bacterium]|jgi:FkbM family methyltransferase|nr:FkbM family methyltransferase [Thermoanaerobaculia bacterium]
MHRFLDFALAQVPSLYSRLVGLRATPNREKVVFLTLLQRDDVVLDVGAHVGYYTRLFSNLVGRDGRVHAFEPVASSFAALRREVELGCRYDNVTLNESALGETMAAAEMFIPRGDLAQAALVRHSQGSWADNGEVESLRCTVDTLDGYVARAGIQRLDFVKCDVEGAELCVLRGGEATLRSRRPLLHVEVFAPWTATFGYRPRDLVRFLESIGYRHFLLLTEFGHVLPLGELERFAAAARESANLICAPPERTERLTRLARRLGAEVAT